MRTSQIALDNKVEFCEYSEPFGSYYRCTLTDFGFVWRCTVEDRKSCPDLAYFLNQQKQGRKK